MADDKNLVDAYASIYNKKEESSEKLNEGVASGLMAAGTALEIGKTVGNVARGIKDKITGANEKVVPASQEGKMKKANEEFVSEIKAPPNQDLERRIDKIEDKTMTPVQKVIKTLTKRPVVYAKKTNEDVAITHLDGSTTEIVDVVKPEALGDADSKLASRLWDQVAANLDTLGEMYGASFDVFELNEKKEKKLDKVGEEDEDVDNDGDVDDSDSYIKNKRDTIGKAMGEKKGKKKDKDMKEEAEQIDEVDCWDTHKKVGMKKKGNKMVNDCRPKNESFNVKSPVIFSKPSEEVVEETISSEQFEKHASYTTYAHRKIAWNTFDMTENREYSHNPEKYHDSEGNPKDMELNKPYRDRSKAARMKDPKRGINSPAFKEFMRKQGM